MWIIKESQLKEFYGQNPDAQSPLVAWIREIDAARFENFVEVKARFGSADAVGKNVVFDIGGNKYRLIVRFRYARAGQTPPVNGIAVVLFIGTHVEYDKLDVADLTRRV